MYDLKNVQIAGEPEEEIIERYEDVFNDLKNRFIVNLILAYINGIRLYHFFDWNERKVKLFYKEVQYFIDHQVQDSWDESDKEGGYEPKPTKAFIEKEIKFCLDERYYEAFDTIADIIFPKIVN